MIRLRIPTMPTNPVGGESMRTINRITLFTKIAVLCATAYCLFSFYRGIYTADSTKVFVAVAILASVLVSCHLMERLCNDKVKQGCAG